MRVMPILAFLPPETIPVIAVAGGLALVIGLRSIAQILFTLCAIMIFLPIIIEPILDMLPEWALPLLIVIFWISVIGMVLKMLIGKGATEHLIGSLAADCIKWLLFLPFRTLRWLFRGLRS